MTDELAVRTDGVVRLRRPRLDDASAFTTAVQRSVGHLEPWVSPPRDETSFQQMVARLGPSYVPSVLEHVESTQLLGAFNLSEVVRGNFLSAYLGYYAFNPHAGRGFMARGMRLLLALAFDDLALHRVEANVQPANERSIALVRAAGFEREGFSKGYLYIDGAWRDHERWAMVREGWARQALLTEG
jgi:ribosomal-protein-alanine N-acetyltransferase